MEPNSYYLLPILLVCLTTALIEAQEDCDHLGTLLYEDLGCTPEIPEGKKCPTRYNCGSFARSNTTCVFQTRTLNVGDEVGNDATYGACRVGCRCHVPYEQSMAGFLCAVLDCPEWLGVPVRPGCYRTYELDKCCSTGQKCPPFDDDTKCVLDAEEHEEGTRFSKGCMDCVCKKGWKGKLEEPFCRRRTCAEQIGSSEDISKNCAPVYLEKDSLCCPDGWVCHSEDQVIKPSNSSSASSGLTCKYGDLDLKIGDKFDAKFDFYGNNKDVTCECVLPPFVTCKGERLK